MPVNEHGQTVGDPVAGWAPRPAPARVTLSGRLIRLEPVSTTHTDDLFAALCGPGDAPLWTYRTQEMPTDPGQLETLLAAAAADPAGVTFALVAGGRARGLATLMRVDTTHGSVEVGSIVYAATLQRTPAATEAMALLARHVFDDLGYRRLEWKCDSGNAPSRRAAVRLGFSYEGRFRQAMVLKGRNRDTDWFSITDAEWRVLAAAYDAWLDPGNFDAEGRQRTRLSELTAARLSGAGGARGDVAAAEGYRGGTDPDGRSDQTGGGPVTLTGQQVEQEALEDWRLLLDALHARFRTGDFATGLRLVAAIGEAAEEMGHHPDVDLRYGHLDIRLTSHDSGGVTQRDVRLARTISRLAAAESVAADPWSVQVVELALDTPDHGVVKPFWREVLGYADRRGTDVEVFDREGSQPTLWFQATRSEDPARQRFHLDVIVPPEVVQPRLDAARAAGGVLVSDAHAPAFWVLADADGNKACLCTWQGRD